MNDPHTDRDQYDSTLAGRISRLKHEVRTVIGSLKCGLGFHVGHIEPIEGKPGIIGFYCTRCERYTDSIRAGGFKDQLIRGPDPEVRDRDR